MNADVRKAEEALARGRHEEALQLLWNALEEARLTNDRESLEGIRRLAPRLEGSGAERLAALVEQVLPEAPAEQHARAATWRRSLIAVLVMITAFAGLNFVLPRIRDPVGPPIEPDGKAAPVEPVPVEQPGVYLVPIGPFESANVTKVAEDLKRRHDVPMTALPSIPLRRSALDDRRDQLIAEELIELLRRAYPTRSGGAVVIGVTQFDMYIRDVSWNYAFSLREGPSYAVIATARMDPVNYGDAPDQALLEARLRKIIGKNIGVLYLRLPLNSNPRSLLYDRILGSDDLDRMTEDFEPSD